MKNKVLRRNKRNLVKVTILTMVAIIIFSLGSIILVSASDTAEKPYGNNKYYASITVEKNATLWSIADEYGIHSGDKKEFINDVISMNNMTNDTIYSGQNLIVYYYSDEQK